MVRFIRSRTWLTALALFFLASLLYLPTLSGDFLDWDDSLYIRDNPHLHGIDLSYLRWAFTTFYNGHWIPLVWLSFGVDHALWGLDPMGYHLSNIVLHALNSALVFILARLLFACRMPDSSASLSAAALVGVLFAAHPLHVESVAWVTERKDLLYALFYLGALLTYVLRAQERTGRPWRLFGLSLLLFGCALMSKPMAVSLPAALLILDWYPLGRIRSRADLLPKAVVEKLPYYLLSAVGSLVAVKALANSELLLPNAQATANMLYPLKTRVLTAFHALGQYARDTLLPTGLVPYHPPVTGPSLSDARYLLPALLVLSVTALAILFRKKAPVVLASWLFFLATIFPSLGLSGMFGVTSVADRFMYLPVLGFLVPAAAAGAIIWERGGAKARGALLGLAAAATVALILLTIRQESVWRDSLHLWQEVATHHPDDALVQKNFGMAQYFAGEYEDSVRSFSRSIERYRFRPANYLYRGLAYAKLGRFQEALRDLSSAVEFEEMHRMVRTAQAVRKDLALYHEKKAEVLETMGRAEEALSEIDKALSLHEGTAQRYLARGRLLVQLGHYAPATEAFGRSLSLEPDLAEAQRGLEQAQGEAASRRPLLPALQDPPAPASGPRSPSD